MRKDPARRLLWTVVVLLAACQTSSRQSTGVVAPTPSEVTVPGRPLPPRPSDLSSPIEIAVRIEAAEGQDRLILKNGSRTLTVRRLGEGLEADGRLHPRLVLQAGGSGNEVSWDGKRYGGRFEVLPHPQGGLRLINRLDLETYVEGVVAGELPLWSAQPAELEAQAIAARTYALYTLAMRGALPPAPGSRRVALSDSVADQAYCGLPANAVDDVRSESSRRRMVGAVRTAVEKTRGRVLTRHGRLEDVRYHASCGGRTSDIETVFSETGAGSDGIDCPCDEADAGAQQRKWKITFTPKQLGELARTLGIGERIISIEPIQEQPWRWSEVQVAGDSGQVRVSFLRLRGLLGPSLLRSGRIEGTWPHPGETIQPGGGWAVYGAGHGHGAGLCQTGTHLLAQRDWSSVRILRHYFAGTVVQSL
ncbi:MAG TPA: SpoIID/LytB domain-containing protein [Planctomycetes bacterium]|nr:SpoIID/LytB domain-containing protein [Planctomycetota bacterium]HIK61057.1 SpoIID/LytB domain-containing protein [Planctomycetota bacterium]